MGPSTAGPVSTPIRRVPPSIAATAARARKAARAARSGSSSCASGAPNMACSPPPDTDVTVPPSASTSAITAARQRPVTSRSSSGSARPVRGHLGGQHADGPELLPRRGLRPGRPGLEGGRGVHLLQPRGQAEPELAEGGPAALVGAYRELPVSLGEVAADQGRGRLLGGGVVLGAGRPGGELGFGPCVACPPGPVPGQGQPRLLAQRLQPLPRAQRPVGVRLVGEQLAVVGQGGREQVVALLARPHRQRGAQSLLVFGRVDLDGRVRPDVGQVGLEQGRPRPAERRERRPGHRQRLGDRTGGRTRVQIREELLADEVPADPPAGAHQDKLAEPPGARPRPRARGAAPGDDGERPEQPDPYGHVPIVPHLSRAFPAREPAGTPREQRLPTVAAEPSERGIRDVHGVPDLPGRAAQVRSRAARDRCDQRQAGRGDRPVRPVRSPAGQAGASPAPDLAAGAGTPGRPAPRPASSGAARGDGSPRGAAAGSMEWRSRGAQRTSALNAVGRWYEAAERGRGQWIRAGAGGHRTATAAGGGRWRVSAAGGGRGTDGAGSGAGTEGGS